jgi:hypothetical protein
MPRKPIAIDHFHVTQQLGFKKVLHCWCGATFDENQNFKRGSKRRWTQEHEDCEIVILPEYRRVMQASERR